MPGRPFDSLIFPIAPRMLLLGLTLLAAIPLGCGSSPSEENSEPVVVLCAASAQKPLTELAQRFEDEYGVSIRLQFGGTSFLVHHARLTGTADLLISADHRSTQRLLKSFPDASVHEIARQLPVIAMSGDQTEKIATLNDLAGSDLRFGLGDVEATSIGVVTLSAAGDLSKALYDKAEVTRTTVTALATDLQVGSIDAAVIWDSTARNFELPFSEASEFHEQEEALSCINLKPESDASTVTLFRLFLCSEEARSVFTESGFSRQSDSNSRGLRE